MKSKLVTIGIVNWNTASYLGNLLDQIRSFLPGWDVEIIVVDNNSEDKSVAMLESRFPEVNLIKNGSNVGFTRACNQILAAAGGKYVALVNTDVVLQPGTISGIVELMEQEPSIGICGPKLFNRDGTLQLSAKKFHTLSSSILEEIPILNAVADQILTKRLGKVLSDHNIYQNVDYVSGAIYVIRKAILQEVGQFDENYYLYCQEVDYSYRSRMKNWPTVYYPYVSAIHFRGESTAKLYWRRLFFLYRDRYFFMTKIKNARYGYKYLIIMLLIKMAQYITFSFVKNIHQLRHDIRNELYTARGLYRFVRQV